MAGALARDIVEKVTGADTVILELEKEAFVSLCGEKKTQERIMYMLSNGKPLRN